MTRKKPKRARPASTKALVPVRSASVDFDEVIGLIETARSRAFAAVNTELIDLYWRVGEYISRKIEADGWGKGTIEVLARHIERREPGLAGFSASNLWRMRQFFDVYRGQPKLATLLRELTWSHNLAIMSRCKRDEEREFYLRLAIRERWSFRELQRQLNGALFERTVLSPPKLAPVLRELHPDAIAVFKDTYLLDFLNLPDPHSEHDLQRALVANLRRFLLELGGDFTFVGQAFRLQVGGRDFFIDLLFFHRGLNCLVAFELKVEEFQPEHLGKLEFYLEALDRDVKKPHEGPSIGVLLCATQNQEVVEYALSRSVSPAVIAEYQTQLPDRKLLRAKLHEFYELAQAQAARPALENPLPSRAKPGKSRTGPKK
jgi:predicted nuclease of restriction endonuclease-like (RecB) superfamily